jgi:hypothetical protein
VELHQVERLDAEIGKAAVDEGLDVSSGVAVGNMRIEPTSGLGGDEGPFAAAFLQDRRNNLLGAAIAVDVRRIDEGDAAIERGVERALAVFLADIAPGAADLPGAKADLRNRSTRPS